MIKVEEQKQSIWTKNLNLAFVYIFVFLFGLVVVFIMTTVLNNKVKEINEESYVTTTRNM